MATKLRKRLSTKENKLLKFDNLEIKDVICSICQSILVEPVTLPCYHYFCLSCFNGSVENNSLCCPLCRLRIGSWLRTARKQKNLVNNSLWDYVQKKFSNEIDTKLKGGDVYLEVTEKPTHRLSAPGEIRSEYETELKRLREERLRLEQKQLRETELLIKKIQLDEAEAQKRYQEMLKQDELLAKRMQKERAAKSPAQAENSQLQKGANTKPTLKPTRIDDYLTKRQGPVTISSSPILTDDNTSTDSSTPSIPTLNSRASPEIDPSDDKVLKNHIEEKINNSFERHSACNDTEHLSKKCDKVPGQSDNNNTEQKNETVKIPPPLIRSLRVSLPLPFSRLPLNTSLTGDQRKFIPLGVIQQRHALENRCKRVTNPTSESEALEKEVPKKTVIEHKGKESTEVEGKTGGEKLRPKNTPQKGSPQTAVQLQKGLAANDRVLTAGSEDSMHQELCYFKPIEKSASLSFAQCNTTLPLRVPGRRARGEACRPPPRPALPPPSRAQYIEGLCRLRHLSLAKNLSSAFVIALNFLQKEAVAKSETNKRAKRGVTDEPVLPIKRNGTNRNRNAKATVAQSNGDAHQPTPSRRRTRSMGSMAHNEATPKKVKISVKSISERKPHLRSDSKKNCTGNNVYSPISKTINSKIRSVTKNLNEPLNNCDVKTILEQIKIQKMIEQEKRDIELARKVDAEINGRRQRQAQAIKRQVTLNYALRPAKKLKV